MDENTFWKLIESAWKSAGGKTQQRQQLAAGTLSEDGADLLIETLAAVIPALRKQLDALPARELIAFDRMLERRLYDIDREEIQKHTDGSNDGFMYARGFIVAAGRAYYDAVNAKPEIAMMDLECEDICYLAMHLYEEKFGEIPDSGISRESCSNKAGWPGLK